MILPSYYASPEKFCIIPSKKHCSPATIYILLSIMLLSLLLLSLLVSLWHAKMQLNVLKGHHHIPLSFRCYWGVGWLFACLKDVAPVSDNWLTWRLLFPSGWWQRRFLLPFFRWTADNIPGEVSWYLTVLRLLPVLLLMLLFIKESCLFYLMATLARERRSTH